MEIIKLNIQEVTALLLITANFLCIFITYMYYTLYHKYNKLVYEYNNIISKSNFNININKEMFEDIININISDVTWEKICNDNSYADYLIEWIADTYSLGSSEYDSDSDSDYIPSESGSSSVYSSDTESDLSESEVTELKITRSTQKDIKVD